MNVFWYTMTDTNFHCKHQVTYIIAYHTETDSAWKSGHDIIVKIQCMMYKYVCNLTTLSVT
jgi:hypothetical protein